MGAFFSRLPCGGTMVEPDRGEPSFRNCSDEYCIYCGKGRELAEKMRKHMLHWLLPNDGWGEKARTTFGINEVADHIVNAKPFTISRNHNFTGKREWYNIHGEITLPFSALITEDELVELQEFWVERFGSACPVDQNLDHPNAPKSTST